MKGKIIAVFLTVLLVCGGYFCNEKMSGFAAEMPKEHEMEIVIIYDKKDQRLDELARHIQKKMNGRIYGISEEEKESWNLEQADLILIGGVEENQGLSLDLQEFLAKTDFQGKKLSPFWLTENWQEEPIYEEKFRNLVRNGVITPGIGVTWKEEYRQDELGRIDGWLTTACTF